MNTLFDQGGVILWIQAVFLFVMLVFLFERILFFQGESSRLTDLLMGVKNHLKSGRRDEAIEAAERTPGAASRVVRAILQRGDLPRSDQRMIADEAIMLEQPAVEKNLRGLLGISLLAPLTGLFGTVLGILQILKSFNEFDAKALAIQGLYESLITSLVGLGVAFLSYLAYLWMHGRAQSLGDEMRRVAIETINLVNDYREH